MTTQLENDSETGESAWNRYRVLGVIVAVAIAGFWIWAFSPLPKRGNPDRLSDREFAVAAELICADARSQIDALGNVLEVGSFDERAGMVDDANAILTTMVAELRASPMDNADEADWIGEWLDDYETYIGDRGVWAERLRSGDDGAPEFTVRENESVQIRITGFPRVNDMPSCEPPGDV